ncbi:hypothetical protein AB4Y96_13785 [Phyllobacterium sp. TAF24]|uniref:hypothetical protein n=1 Tax=unclassified Phyllobacterium TaxID=2638441 RepID=UPI0008806BBA|nr:hypothetical protein [Phyllobacterium sp. OV277]SDO50894.1 hypothetical protein SAMN05443582_102370 [Phyllobacterium sp. OV277]
MLGLPALIGMIVVGISVGVFAVHLAGGSKRPALADDQQAQSIFLLDYPESRIGTIIYTQSRRTAFLELPAHRTGIVHGMGNKFLTRNISLDDVHSAEPAGVLDLKLRLHDMTWPRQTFSFANETDRNTVRRWLSAGGITNERTHVL